MHFLLDEFYDLLKRELNPYLGEKGLSPLKRFSLQPLSSDILPSLNITLKELSVAKELSSQKEKAWRGIFSLSLLLRESGEDEEPQLSSYVEAICQFLEERKISPILKGACLKISPLPSKKPLQRGVNIEYEILYLP